MNTGDVRGRNLAAVLGFLDDAKAAARAEIAEATGLVRGSVTLLATELIGARLVRAAKPGSDVRSAGRPRERLEIDGPDLGILVVQFVLGELRVLAVDLGGRDLVRRIDSVVLPFADPAGVAALIAETIVREATALTARGVRLLSTRVVVPAPVMSAAGIVPVAVDFGWQSVELARLVTERLPAGIPTPDLANDADCAMVAEFASLGGHAPEGRPRDVVYLKSDTGIGGGAMVAGELLLGRDGLAFEPGHVVVVPGGKECRCGRRGCLVTVAGPEVVLEAADLSAFAVDHGIPAAEAELLRREAVGDAAAKAAVAELIRWLMHATDVFDVLFRPQLVVLGGYLSALVERVTAVRAVLTPDDYEGVPLVAAAHGDYGSVDGAAYLLRRALLADPIGLMTRQA
jgi:predicted NBD/HSP70 family sugar kinase